jgi:DNA polymerase-4
LPNILATCIVLKSDVKESMERSVMHMDMDTFFVSVERKLNSSLNGKPVLVGGSSDRGVVASCSYEARAFGIHSAMPMKMARHLCPDAIIVRGDHEEYTKHSDAVTDIVKEAVPVYEKASIDEFYMDLTGMDKFFGCYQVAKGLRKRIIKETGLPISFALSSNKTVAKVGTGEAKPNGYCRVLNGEEKGFLAPLSIKKIPMVGDKTYQLLRNMGVKRIRTLQEMPVQMMEQVLGENGIVIWRKANGIDNSPVEPYSERKSISTECTFEKDTIDMVYLNAILIRMVEKLGFQLRNEQKLTSCVTVKIRYSDFNTYTVQSRIGYTALDHILLDKIKELFSKLYQKRMLIRLVGIRFSHLVHGTYQIDMFNDTTEHLQLYQAMDRLRRRFDKNAVQRAAGLGTTMREFNPFNGIRNNQPLNKK